MPQESILPLLMEATLLIDRFRRALDSLFTALLRAIRGSNVPDNVVITVAVNGTQGYVALCNNYLITPAQGTNWLTFSIATPGWSFVTTATPPPGRTNLRSPKPPTPQAACGIWVDDPNLNFSCVRFAPQLVVLYNSNADVATMPYHYYAVLMTNGVDQIELDPMARDRGGPPL